MSKFLSEVKGFTPVIDVLAQELGLMSAVVYGIVWRYCQMEDRVCTASRKRIAEHADISVKTVERHLKRLCKAGYLKDLTPDQKHRPHVYADSGKAKIMGLLTVEVGTTESLTSDLGKTESLTRSDSKSNLGKTESLIRKPSYDREDEREDSNFESSSLDSSISGETVWEEPEESELMEVTIEKLSRTFGDSQHLKSNVTRAYNLWDDTSLGEQEFIAMLEEAARITKENISKGMVRQRGKRMAYFFSVLESLL
jgi:DNA-binding MarR family transcriptional regulator